MRAWERSGELLPARRTRKGTRYYAISDPLGFRSDAAATVGYARVSSHDQKADLDRQHAVLEAYCAAKGWQCTIVRDLGLNYRKKGLQRVLEMILRREAAGPDAQGPGGSVPSWFSACASCKASRSSTRVNNRASRRSLRKTFSRSSRCSARGCTALALTSPRSCWMS